MKDKGPYTKVEWSVFLIIILGFRNKQNTFKIELYLIHDEK